MISLGSVEYLANIAIMKVNDFVYQRCAGLEYYRRQCRIAAGGIQIAQVLGGHLTTFAGQL